MKEKIASALALILAISLCSCTQPPRGFYVSQSSEVPCCMEFRGNGKVIVRDLSGSSLAVDETTFVVEKGVVRIRAFKLGGKTLSTEFSIIGDTLVTAEGWKLTKDTSGKTYTPAELLADSKRRAAEAEEERLSAIKANRQREAAKVETQQQQDAERERSAALAKQREEERARSIEEAKAANYVAKLVATQYLPVFTNQVVTLTLNDGTTCSNICLKRASLDGIVYKFTDAVGGGVIPYNKLDTTSLEELAIDTNMVAVADERAVVKAEVDRQYRQMVTQYGAPRANQYRQAMNLSLADYSAQVAFAQRYGLMRPPPQLQAPASRSRR